MAPDILKGKIKSGIQDLPTGKNAVAKKLSVCLVIPKCLFRKTYQVCIGQKQ